MWISPTPPNSSWNVQKHEHLVRFQVSGRLACVCVFLLKLELPVGYVTTKSNKLINIPMINIISNIGQVFCYDRHKTALDSVTIKDPKQHLTVWKISLSDKSFMSGLITYCPVPLIYYHAVIYRGSENLCLNCHWQQRPNWSATADSCVTCVQQRTHWNCLALIKYS